MIGHDDGGFFLYDANKYDRISNKNLEYLLSPYVTDKGQYCELKSWTDADAEACAQVAHIDGKLKEINKVFNKIDTLEIERNSSIKHWSYS